MSMQTASHRGEAGPIQFRILYSICFSIFLVVAAMRRLLPWTWFAERGNAMRRQSIFGEARNAAGICATYAFMV